MAKFTITIPDDFVDELVDAYCYMRQYLELVEDPDNPEGPSIPNPETRKQFTKKQLRSDIRKVHEGYKKKLHYRDQANIGTQSRADTEGISVD